MRCLLPPNPRAPPSIVATTNTSIPSTFATATINTHHGVARLTMVKLSPTSEFRFKVDYEVFVVVKIWASNQQSILLGFLGTRPRTIKGRPAQTNKNKGPGRGRSKPLRRGDQTKVMTADGVMGRVRGSRRDPRKDEYGKISQRCRRHNWKDCHLESIPQLLVPWRRESCDGRKDRNLVEIDRVEMGVKHSTSPKGEEEMALWLRASSIEIAWRGPMLNVGLVLPRSRGFGDSVWHSNAEMGLHRIDVWRCPLSPLGRDT
ncbi:hypothetical protein Acr_07g0017880 [Actinidia rufa]|uniref:Uncharacterized protein n=1 Tax=Actinidia rufa TaxID=165716 RepID=A0A7J0EYS3_9ERIC|nr:hypothetical protein Acr_07g0017880 [Actinidia rufa]